MIKVPKISMKSPRIPAVKGGKIAMPKIQQMRGKGENAGGLPNNLKRLFPKSSTAKPKY